MSPCLTLSLECNRDSRQEYILPSLDFPPNEAPLVILAAALSSETPTLRGLRTDDSEGNGSTCLNVIVPWLCYDYYQGIDI
jgi:hypothetical protein